MDPPQGRSERKASWTFLTVTAGPLRAPCQQHRSRCMLAKVKRRASGYAEAGLTGPRGDGFPGLGCRGAGPGDGDRGGRMGAQPSLNASAVLGLGLILHDR